MDEDDDDLEDDHINHKIKKASPEINKKIEIFPEPESPEIDLNKI